MGRCTILLMYMVEQDLVKEPGLIEILRRRKEAKLCLEDLTQSIIKTSILMFLSHRKVIGRLVSK